MPDTTAVGGDYFQTQSALLLAMLAEGESRIQNANQGIDTDHTLSFLSALGIKWRKEGEEIIIVGRNFVFPEKMEFEYDGGLYPLSLIIGFLSGLAKESILTYSDQIGAKAVAIIISALSDTGMELDQDSEARRINIKASRPMPIEKRIKSSYPYQKNALLMLGLSSGHSAAIREDHISDTTFENIIIKMGGKLAVKEAKSELVEDPNDPRRKVRISNIDYKREIMLYPSIHLSGTLFEIEPNGFDLSALITLAVLKRAEWKLPEIVLSNQLLQYINYLKGIGADISIENRRHQGTVRIADISIAPGELKAKKMAGETIQNLIHEIPFLVLLAGSIPETSIFRNLDEFGAGGVESLREMAENLEKMGIKCGVMADGLVIEGKKEINGGNFGPFNNSVVALAFYLAALAGHGKTVFSEFETVLNNFPTLVEITEPIQDFAAMEENP
jgi:3-phosphoshikimate 1-carboxyvinyltransferase